MADSSSQEEVYSRTISSFAQEVFTRWSVIEKLDTESAASWRQVMSDELSRFRLWSNNLGACHDVDDPESADHRLRVAPDVQKRLVLLLGELCESLEDIQAILSGTRQGQEEELDDICIPSGNDSNTPLRSEISELWLMVEDIITNLMKVAAFVRASNNWNSFELAIKAATRANTWSVPTMDRDIKHVRHKFPKLEGKQWLIQRLSKTSTRRRTILIFEQDRERFLAHGKGLDENKTVKSQPTEASTGATMFSPTDVYMSILQRLKDCDHDNAMSTTSTTTYNTVGGDDTGADTLSVARLSSVCVGGRPAICPYCHASVHFKREGSWRRHVFNDLVAYSCTFEHCQHPPFKSRAEWATHERHDHLRSWRCPICQQKSDTQTHVMNHMAADHPSIGNALKSELIRAASPQIERVPKSHCPFCDDCRLPEGFVEPHLSSTSQDDPQDEPNVRGQLIPVAQYQLHVSRHMEQLALFAVQSVADFRGSEKPNPLPSRGIFEQKLGRDKFPDSHFGSDLTHRRAVDIAGITKGSLDPTVGAYLEAAVTEIEENLNASPDTYVFSRGEFLVFNYFRHRFQGEVSERAVDRYWLSSHGADVERSGP